MKFPSMLQYLPSFLSSIFATSLLSLTLAIHLLCGLNCILSKGNIDMEPLVPVNVTLFGNRVCRCH